MCPLEPASGHLPRVLNRRARLLILALLTSDAGAEGLELAPETEIALRDEPEGFAVAIARLLSDPAAARAQAAAARTRIEMLYDWRNIGREFVRALARRDAA